MKSMRYGISPLLLLLLLAVQAVGLQSPAPQSAVTPEQAVVPGRWQVKFTIAGVEKNLILVSQAKGVGSILFLDTAPDDKPVPEPQPAAWAQLSGNRISFSGEAELPMGTCCREMGTLIFKGKFSSNNSITGKFIFVTSVDEEESPYKLRSEIGTFTATRVPK
jgi:hypothetical protein